MSNKKLEIEATNKSPYVMFDPEKGLLEIKGRSIPENSVEFYNPLMKLLDEFAHNPSASKTQVNIHLEYFNTSSSKCLLDIFKKLESINEKGSEVIVNWHFEEDDEDMQEAGEDYQAITNLKFNMIQVAGE